VSITIAVIIELTITPLNPANRIKYILIFFKIIPPYNYINSFKSATKTLTETIVDITTATLELDIDTNETKIIIDAIKDTLVQSIIEISS
jgi:hypothetical protein